MNLAGEFGFSKKPVNPKITVASAMSKGVVTLNPDDNFAKSVDLMARGGFRHLVITDDMQRVVGVLSDRDLLGARSRISEWRFLKVHQLMTVNPICVNPEMLLSDAVVTMISKRVNCLPVIDRAGKLCGLVTSTDVMRSFQNMLESMQASDQ